MGGSHNLNMNVILLKDTHWINFKEKLFFFIITWRRIMKYT